MSVADLPPIAHIDWAGRRDQTGIAILQAMERECIKVIDVTYLPPGMLKSTKERTAFEMAITHGLGMQRIEVMARRFGKTYFRSLLKEPPTRRRWDQYGAYHKRMLKKYFKNPWRFRI